MKSILIIGLGRFGHHLCRNLVEMGNQVMIVDEKEDVMDDLLFLVTSAKIGDCTNEEVLKSLGVSNFDLCFVCIGSNFQSSLEITSLLKEMGAKYVISKANRDIHAKFLLRNGADEVVYPDRDIAEKLAIRHSTDKIYDYVEVPGAYSIYEIPPLPEWVGKSIFELDIRQKHQVSILGVKENERLNLLLDSSHVFKEEEHVLIIGRDDDLAKVLQKL
ncbi:MAG: TrkA family potassium uptake protein [Lachnospiraceae bacterium]|nr:TrkA family potassium uptake protein [Lachnospiraceae bacterium]